MRQQERGWANIISAVKTPLGFFALVVLVLESFLVALAWKSETHQTLLIWAFVLVLVLLIVVVGGTHFYEIRHSQNIPFAIGLAEEIFGAFDGSLRNLDDRERALAYGILQDSVKNSPHAQSDGEKRFLEVLVATIIRKAELKGRWEALSEKDD